MLDYIHTLQNTNTKVLCTAYTKYNENKTGHSLESLPNDALPISSLCKVLDDGLSDYHSITIAFTSHDQFVIVSAQSDQCYVNRTISFTHDKSVYIDITPLGSHHNNECPHISIRDMAACASIQALKAHYLNALLDQVTTSLLIGSEPPYGLCANIDQFATNHIQRNDTTGVLFVKLSCLTTLLTDGVTVASDPIKANAAASICGDILMAIDNIPYTDTV